MSALIEPGSSSPTVPAPAVMMERTSPPPRRETWLTAIAPAYLGVFVWAPFYDQLWVHDLGRSHLAWLFASALGAGLICHLVYYWGLAQWGCDTGLPVEALAASTFGTAGSRWLAGVAPGLAGLVIWAIAIDFAVDSTLIGLVSSGLCDASSLSRWTLGPWPLPPPVFLSAAIFWVFIIVMANQLRLIGVVAALMRVYSPVALLVLTAIAIWVSPGLRSYPAGMAPAAMVTTFLSARAWTGPSALQLFCGYFALAGLASADRGAAVKGRRDVALGGVVGVAVAGAWSAMASLVVVASAVGFVARPDRVIPNTVIFTDLLSFRWAILQAIGGGSGGTVLILLGLAALAPACYGSWTFARKLGSSWPRIAEPLWVWAGGLCVLSLVASRWASRTSLIFSAMGDLFAPMIGAMLADRLLQRGEWAGPRGAYNRVGLLAWAAGVATALGLDLALVQNPALTGWMPPTSLLGLAGAGVAYFALAAAGWEPPAGGQSTATAIGAEPRTTA